MNNALRVFLMQSVYTGIKKFIIIFQHPVSKECRTVESSEKNKKKRDKFFEGPMHVYVH